MLWCSILILLPLASMQWPLPEISCGEVKFWYHVCVISVISTLNKQTNINTILFYRINWCIQTPKQSWQNHVTNLIMCLLYIVYSVSLYYSIKFHKSNPALWIIFCIRVQHMTHIIQIFWWSKIIQSTF